MEIIIYTRVGCHLCDEAKATLESYGLEGANRRYRP